MSMREGKDDGGGKWGRRPDLYSVDLMHCHARNDYPRPIALTKVTVGTALSNYFLSLKAQSLIG